MIPLANRLIRSSLKKMANWLIRSSLKKNILWRALNQKNTEKKDLRG